MQNKYYYLIHLQFLGYRYHGWLEQPEVKTVQLMLRKTIQYILGHDKFKTIASGRTDAMVSAEHLVVEIILEHNLEKTSFLNDLNDNLPQDIRAMDLEETDAQFNLIQHPKIKHYKYLFAFGQKFHPFCAPIMANFKESLDIEKMKTGASLFEGEHNFKNYIYNPNPATKLDRKVNSSFIEENLMYSANFFPDVSYIFHCLGEGFARYQIRMMMGQLVRLGKGEITLDDIRYSLEGKKENYEPYIAPASGLILHKIEWA